MTQTLLKLFFALILIAGVSANISAQTPDASSADGKSDLTKDLPDGLKETLAKQRIKAEEKEYQDLLARGEEAAKLVEELNSSLENRQTLDSTDLKKIDRLEKIVKKIRSDLGAEDDSDETDSEQPRNLMSTLKEIKEDTGNLLSEIKKIGRHTISVVAIESSNSLLKLVRFLRFNKN